MIKITSLYFPKPKNYNGSNLVFRILADKSLMGNGSEICEKLLKLRGPGAGGNIKGDSSLVTGNTSSLISQLGTLCQDEDKPETDPDRFCLPSHQVLTPDRYWNLFHSKLLIRIYRGGNH